MIVEKMFNVRVAYGKMPLRESGLYVVSAQTKREAIVKAKMQLSKHYDSVKVMQVIEMDK